MEKEFYSRWSIKFVVREASRKSTNLQDFCSLATILARDKEVAAVRQLFDENYVIDEDIYFMVKLLTILIFLNKSN